MAACTLIWLRIRVANSIIFERKGERSGRRCIATIDINFMNLEVKWDAMMKLRWRKRMGRIMDTCTPIFQMRRCQQRIRTCNARQCHRHDPSRAVETIDFGPTTPWMFYRVFHVRNKRSEQRRNTTTLINKLKTRLRTQSNVLEKIYQEFRVDKRNHRFHER